MYTHIKVIKLSTSEKYLFGISYQGVTPLRSIILSQNWSINPYCSHLQHYPWPVQTVDQVFNYLTHSPEFPGPPQTLYLIMGEFVLVLNHKFKSETLIILHPALVFLMEVKNRFFFQSHLNENAAKILAANEKERKTIL